MSVAVGVHPVSGQKRITLTGYTIQQAQQVIFLITGASKSKLVSQIIHEKQPCENYPAYQVATKSASIFFYLDKAAAMDLDIANLKSEF